MFEIFLEIFKLTIGITILVLSLFGMIAYIVHSVDNKNNHKSLNKKNLSNLTCSNKKFSSKIESHRPIQTSSYLEKHSSHISSSKRQSDYASFFED